MLQDPRFQQHRRGRQRFEAIKQRRQGGTGGFGVVHDQDQHVAPDEIRHRTRDAELARLRPARGRPVVAIKRPMLSMRVDPDVLAHLRASGKGWQTKVNALLRRAVEQGKV